MNYQDPQVRQAHLHYLRESIKRLNAAEPDWSAADRKRGEATIRNLEGQIEAIHAYVCAKVFRPAQAS